MNFDELSLYMLFALILGAFVDTMIVGLTRSKPQSPPPTPFRSWSGYFSKQDQEALTKLFVHKKSKKGCFYIPRGEKELIALLLPLESENVVEFKGEACWCEKLFLPTYIKRQSDGFGFNHYQVNVDIVAQWICDWKSKQQRQAVALQNVNDSQSSSNGSAYKSNADLPPFPSCSGYFSKQEQEALTKLFVHGKGKKGYFYIPRGEKELIALLLPLESDNVVEFIGEVSWYKKPFLPAYIRKQSDGFGFNCYQVRVDIMAQWICDWKSKQQWKTVALQNVNDERLSSNGSLYKNNTDLPPDTAMNTQIKSSLNGDSKKGVENDTR